MKTLIAAVALTIAFPAAAYTQAAPQSADHAQHQGMNHDQHKGMDHGNVHKDCCEHKNADGTPMKCCEKAAKQGKKMECCDKAKGQGQHSGHEMKH